MTIVYQKSGILQYDRNCIIYLFISLTVIVLLQGLDGRDGYGPPGIMGQKVINQLFGITISTVQFVKKIPFCS